jgi:Tfp pilus assembly protein PilN
VPGVELSTTDPRALAAPEVAALPSLAASRARERGRRRRFWGCAAAAALALLLALVAILAVGGWLLGIAQRLFG